MSDILVLVADIRHPLFHFPPSLYKYVTEYHKKPLILLLNKVIIVYYNFGYQLRFYIALLLDRFSCKGKN